MVSCTGNTLPSDDSVIPIENLPDLPPRQEVSLPPAEDARPVRDLRIALVGEVRGEVEPCGCPTLPYGGFVRRERLLAELRADPVPLFHLDAGDLLLKGFSSTRDATDSRGDAILTMSAMVGVDAWAPGPSDLIAIGLDGLQDVPIPAISATWADLDGQLLLPPSIVLERDGIRLGVIGLSAPPADTTLREQLTLIDPVEAARSAAQGLPDDLDLIVALGSLSDLDTTRVSRDVPELAAILSTQGSNYDEPFSKEGGPALIEAPDRGRYLSMVHLRLGAGPSSAVRLLPDAQEWRERLVLRDQVRRLGGDELAASLREAEAVFTELGTGRNLGYQDALPLSEAYDGEAAVSSVLSGFLTSLVEDAIVAAERPVTPLEPGYASSGGCSGCHIQEFGRWAYTDHAQSAWLSLVGRDATENPECIGCHTTGFGESGGFGELTPANLRKFKGVQCEACHGPLRGHNGQNEVRGQPVTEAGCVRCHDAANSPDFDFATYLPRASCQQASSQ